GGDYMGIILIVVVGYFIYKYMEDNQGGVSTSRKQNSALDILNERYAKGEIDEEEYRNKKESLNR
ncbi:MAG: SHOCT domain-containing protein, partial [Alkalibacterium sp.]|uniref:SHOCT domain-containing protein n=1 Tax=Alkalibacterium sp. TaxID=1872447 RepID=UPI0026485465